MADFPSLVPTARSFQPGVYPQKTYRTLSGAAFKRSFGNRAYGAQLELSFDNIPDASAYSIVNHYRSQTSQNQRFRVSGSTTAGMSSSLDYLAAGTADDLRWEYAEPPSVQSVRPGRSSVRVKLSGEIRNPERDDA